MATKKTEPEEFPGFEDDDDGGGPTISATHSRSGARGMADATSSALQAMLARAPTAAPTSATVPELPDVTAPDLSDIAVVVPAPEPVSAIDLGATFAALRRDFAEARDRRVGEEIAAGDEVLVDVIGYAAGKVIPFSVRSDIWVDATPDADLPGLFEGLVGAPVGESIVIDVDLPADYPVAALQGAFASFAVTVQGAREVSLPDDSDPTFLRATGMGGTLGEVMHGLRVAIEERRDEDQEDEAQQRVIDELAARVQVDVSDKLIDEEIRRRWLDAEGKTLAALGHEFAEQEEALAAWQQDERTRVLAIRSLKLGFAIGAIAKRDGVVVDKDVVDGFLEAFAEGTGLAMKELADVVQRDKASQRVFADKLLHIITLEHVMDQVDVQFMADR